MKEYAIYKGDKFIDIGTAEYLAMKLGVKPATIRFYTTDVYKKRIMNGSDYLIAVELPEINWSKAERKDKDD